ncbi:hypothetical protein ACNAN0_11150 [Agrilactobacillus fermenti]|uniref:hypothetical protein n=1 Tax=Agrilactobacillus fermenti TaxID=2586909 RepID=UPI001E318775|nr:hypothetical protein [Agrilactobacillus fermenti]MCD2256941.1 hypothetical protein [Agrilactobacillus fermenti]
MKLMHKSFLASLSAIFLGLSTATLFSFSNVQATATTKILDDTSVETAAPGNTIASDAPTDATATGTSQAAIGFKEGGMQVFAPNFGFADLPLMATDTTYLNSDTVNKEKIQSPATSKYRLLTVNDYTAAKDWNVSVAVGQFRKFDKNAGTLDNSKVLKVSSLSMDLSQTRLYHGTPLTTDDFGTTDPNRIEWTRAYQYDNQDQPITDNGKIKGTNDVPLNKAPWQFEDTSDAPSVHNVSITPFDDSDATATDVHNFSEAEREPDAYYPDWTKDAHGDYTQHDYTQVEKEKHESILKRFNGTATKGLNGDAFRNNFKIIWGSDPATTNEGQDHYYGKGWWALDFHSKTAAELHVPTDSQVEGTYKATMYWVLSSAPIA